jgi:hypothetical protein
MADLNSLIAQGFQFKEPPDPFAQYAQMQQLQQGEQANQLNQMKMQEYQRGMAETNAMRRLDPSSATYLQDVKRINPKTGFEFAKLQQEAKSAGTESQIKDVKLLADKMALLPDAYRRADTPEAYLALHRSIHADPVVGPWLSSIGATPEKGLAALRTAMDTGKFDELRTGSMQSVNQILEGMKPLVVGPSSSVLSGGVFKQAPAAPEKTPPPPAMVAEFNFAKTPEGGNFRGSYQDFVTARAAAGRAPAMPRPEQPPVAVVDPVTGKPVFVSRETAISGKMSPASAQESLPPKEIQKREAALPQATSAVTGFEKKADSFVKDLTALRDHPGLSEVTGIAAGRLPGITAAGRAAQAIYDKVVAKGGFQALQDLRDASKTGGALGNVSNQEGKQLTASFSAIDRRQNAEDVKAAIEQAIGDVQGAKTRMREAYDSTYAYKTPAAAAGQNALSPAEQTELDQLRKRFGGK